MKYLLLCCIALPLAAFTAFAQNSVVNSLVLKGNGGNRLTLTAPPGMTSNLSLSVPLLPSGGSLLGTDASGNLSLPDGGYIQLTEGPSAGGVHWTRVVAGDQSTDITWTLPNAMPSDNQVLTAVSTSSNAVTLGWTTPSGAGTSAYGYVYQLATLADATVVGGADIPFSNTGPANNVTHVPGTTTIVISNTGQYEVNYQVSITAGIGSALAIAVNGVVDASTVVNTLVATGIVSGKAIITLNAGDVITLRNNSLVALTLGLAPAVSGQLTIRAL
jgi:hypothetical protein